MAVGHYDCCDFVYYAAVCADEISELNITLETRLGELGYSCLGEIWDWDAFTNLMTGSARVWMPSRI